MSLRRWLLVSACAGLVSCSGEFGVRGVLAPGEEGTDGAGGDREADQGAALPAGEDPPPAVRIDAPLRGAFVDAAASSVVEVTGRVVAGRATVVRVDGEPAELAADGGFRYVDESPEVGVRHYRVEAQDAAGRIGSSGLSVLYGTLAPADEPVPDALSVHVGPAVLDDVALSVRDLVDGIDFERLAMDQNPVASDWWGTLTVEGLSRGRVAVSLEPRDAGLAIELRVADIDIDLHNDAPGPWNQDGWARADDTVLSGIVDVFASDGAIDARLADASVELEGFDFDVSGIEGESIVRGRVEDMLRGELEDVVRDRVPPLLERALSSLDLTRDFDVAGTTFTLAARFESVDVDARGLSLRAAASVRANASAGVPASPGTLRTPSAAPQIGTDRLVAALADDVVDQVLSAAWAAGLLDREIALTSPGTDEPLTLSFVTLIVPSLLHLAPEDSPVVATIDPLLPPIIRFEETGGATLSIGELHVILEADTPDGRKPLVTLALAIDADLEAQIVDGEASLSLRDVRFVADPVEAPETFPEGQPLQELLDGIVELVAPDIARTIASFTLPAIQDLRLTECELGQAGPAGDFLTIACDTEHE